VTWLILGPSETVNEGPSNGEDKSRFPACTVSEPTKCSLPPTKATGNVPTRNSGPPSSKHELSPQEYQHAKKCLRKAVVEYYRCVSFVFAGFRGSSACMRIVALYCSASLWRGKINARFPVLAMRIPRANHLFSFPTMLQAPAEANFFPYSAASRYSIITVYVTDLILVIFADDIIGI
jgi:hypothetical protein